METIVMFLKFGSQHDINDLYENGTIYMNTVQYFRDREDAELRGDKYEGVSELINYPRGIFEIPSINFKGNYLNIHLRKGYERTLGNIYSLYCISSFTIDNPFDFTIDERVRGFGTHCLMILDNVSFLNRIEEALQKSNYKYHHNFIEYYDRYEKNGIIDVFDKQNTFAYQKEFRIYVESVSNEPLVLKVGSLKDIAQVITVEEVMAFKLVQEKAAL
jgi:hypothetical protein